MNRFGKQDECKYVFRISRGGEDDGSKGNGCIEFMFLLCEMFICEMIGKENFRKVFVVEKKENRFQRDSFVNDCVYQLLFRFFFSNFLSLIHI